MKSKTLNYWLTFFYIWYRRLARQTTCKLNTGAGGGGRAVGVGGEPGRRCQWKQHTRGASSQSAASPPCQVHSPARCATKMMAMNGKQHFSMHPALHPSSEGMRRVCLPAPQVRLSLNSSYCLRSVTLRCFELLQHPIPPSPASPFFPLSLRCLSLSPTCLSKQSCCFHINFYDLCFEEGAWECSLIRS